MKLAELKPDKKNANRGTKRGSDLVSQSLKTLGAGRSVLVDKHGVLIAGNKTAAAAIHAGLDDDAIVVQTTGDQLVVVQRTDLDLTTDPKAKQLAIADNRTSEIGLEWDAAILSEFAVEMDLKPFFTSDELKELIPSASDLPTNVDDTPDPPADPITQPGDLYLLGDHRLLCGDATNPNDIDRLLDGVTPSLVFCDPPYGIAVKMDNATPACSGTIMGDETTDVASAAFRLCSAFNVPSIWWGANHYASDAKLPNSSCWVCWDKQESNNHIDQADCELAWTNFSQPARIFHHLWAGFRRDSEKGEKRVHPTQKPVALLVEILDFFKAGNVILDFFGGSGSTLIACEQTKRVAYMMELDARYCDVIISRWETATGKKAERV